MKPIMHFNEHIAEFSLHGEIDFSCMKYFFFDIFVVHFCFRNQYQRYIYMILWFSQWLFSLVVFLDIFILLLLRQHIFVLKLNIFVYAHSHIMVIYHA